MPAYWIGRAKVRDQDAYSRFVSESGDVLGAYGGKVLVRSANHLVMDGEDDHERHLIVEFGSGEDAQACFNSEEYQKARGDRIGNNGGDVQVTIVFG